MSTAAEDRNATSSQTSKPVSAQQLFREAAQEYPGATVKVLSEDPPRLEITVGGRTLRTNGTSISNENDVVTSAFMKDKLAWSNDLLAAGFHAPAAISVDFNPSRFPAAGTLSKSPAHRRIRQFTDEWGFPVFLKLRYGSQGKNVFAAFDPTTLDELLIRHVAKDRGPYILNEALFGEEYRVVCVGGKIVMATRKQPLTVTGDGVSKVQQLAAAKIKEFRAAGRIINLRLDSTKVISHLAEQGLKLDTVLPTKTPVTLIANKNLSDGASPVLCTEEIRKKYGSVCDDLCVRFGIAYIGLDIIANDRYSTAPVPYFLEGNGHPGFTHFINSDPAHRDIYKEIVRVRIGEALRRQARLYPSPRKQRSKPETPPPAADAA